MRQIADANASTFGERLVNMMGKLTLEKAVSIGLDNAAANLAHIKADNTTILDLANDLPSGDKALVIAAGPSLHRTDTVRVLKESKFNGLIVTTESSMVWCLRNGIKPHLSVTVDPHAERIVRWFGDPELDAEKLAKDDYFERQDMDPHFAENTLERNRDLINLVNRHGNDIRLAIASSASIAMTRRAKQAGMARYWWNPFYDDYDAEDSITRRLYEQNGLPCINAGGNVGAACWVIAHAVLGRTKIGLLGMDFGYYADTPYRQTQYYNELIEIVGEGGLEELYRPIFNPHTGGWFFSDPAYLWYKNVFLEMAETAAADGVSTFNCTGGGILFGEPVICCSFETFVSA